MELKLRGQDLVIVVDATAAIQQTLFVEFGDVINSFGNRRDKFSLGDFNTQVRKEKQSE